MKVKDMQYEFQMHMNQFKEPLQLDSDDVLYWLNKAQEEFVINRYTGRNLFRKAFEQSQQVIDDVRNLVVKNKEIDTNYLGEEHTATKGFYTDYAELPENQLYLVSQRSEIAYNRDGIDFEVNNDKRDPVGEYDTKTVFNRYSQSDDIFTLLSDPFNTTKTSSPLTDISDKGITIYTDKTFLAKKIIINYIRKAKKLSLTTNDSEYTTEPELAEHTHKEIIQLAVDLFLNNTRELKQRLQRETPTADQEQQIEEDNE